MQLPIIGQPRAANPAGRGVPTTFPQRKPAFQGTAPRKSRWSRRGLRTSWLQSQLLPNDSLTRGWVPRRRPPKQPIEPYTTPLLFWGCGSGYRGRSRPTKPATARAVNILVTPSTLAPPCRRHGLPSPSQFRGPAPPYLALCVGVGWEQARYLSPVAPFRAGPGEPWPVVTSTPPCLPLLSLWDRISCSFGVLPPPKQVHCTWVGRSEGVISPWYPLWGTRGFTADFSAPVAFLSLSGGEEGA